MCYNLESTLSRQNLFLDLLISSENTVSADVRTKPQKKKNGGQVRKLFLCSFFCPPFLPLQPTVDSKGFYGR